MVDPNLDKLLFSHCRSAVLKNFNEITIKVISVDMKPKAPTRPYSYYGLSFIALN